MLNNLPKSVLFQKAATLIDSLHDLYIGGEPSQEALKSTRDELTEVLHSLRESLSKDDEGKPFNFDTLFFSHQSTVSQLVTLIHSLIATLSAPTISAATALNMPAATIKVNRFTPDSTWDEARAGIFTLALNSLRQAVLEGNMEAIRYVLEHTELSVPVDESRP